MEIPTGERYQIQPPEFNRMKKIAQSSYVLLMFCEQTQEVCRAKMMDRDNLAYACALCNRAKGSDIGSSAGSGEFTRFFNPRTDRWLDHFRLEGATIQALTLIGEVTTRIFGSNDSARLHEREEMIRFGIFPRR